MTQAEIECFLALCRCKNGTRAAESLFITQSSLSTRLKTLERELGGTLFHRSKGQREMRLTAAGEEFYRLALQYEALIKKMEKVCKAGDSVLRISAYNSIATYFIYDICDRFIKRYPNTELDIQELTLENAVNGLRNGTTDIVFTCGSVSDPMIRATHVISEPMVLIGDPLTEYPSPVLPEQLPPEREIYNEWSADFARWHLSGFPGHGSPRIRVSIIAHMKKFFEKGNCWAVVPLSVARGLRNDTGVRLLDAAFPLPQREISYLTASDSADNDLIRAFTQCLDEVLAEDRA